MVGRGQISGRFWFSADWAAYSCCARHQIRGVVEWVFLKPVRQRVQLMRQRGQQGGNKFYSV